MRKINKICNLSTEYKKWEKNLEEHPECTSSSGKYYKDIVMQLFANQDGLCAYTEQRLCDPKFYNEKYWYKQGTYQNKAPFEGQLDHFDSSLKKEKGWSWDNFFMVHSDINTKIKGSRKVYTILKPDLPDYNPKKYLDYDKKSHRFIANLNLTAQDKTEVNLMLEVLGLNWHPVVRKRRKAIEQYQQIPKEFHDLDEFPTAIEMSEELGSSYDNIDYENWT